MPSRAVLALLAALPGLLAPAQGEERPADTAPAEQAALSLFPDRWPVPQDLYGGGNRSYIVYAEKMSGANFDEKIENAVQRALGGGVAAEVVLPPGHHVITKPIKLWRLRKTKTDDTRAEGIELADIRNLFTSIKGGKVQDLPRGIVLRGATPGATRLFWEGGPNQVVIDLPAPWDVTVKDLQIDGNNTEGLIGIRYRAGWELGANGGKRNLFERISLERLDVGMHIGGAFGPDLVGSTFRQISVHAARIGFRLESANVAEMWFKECFLGSCEEAGFKLIGHSGRVIRSLKEKDAPTDENVCVDADGREIFLEQLPPVLVKQKVNEGQHEEVPGSKRRPWAGGGSPTCFISDLVAHMQHPQAWMIDSNWAPVRLEHVRMEGCSGALRVTGKGMANTRFNDLLIDVNAVTTGGLNGYAIEYHKAGPIYFLGGTFEGPIGLGQNAICYSVGTRFLNRGRQMPGYVKADRELPADCFYKRTGQAMTIPYRRWPGERVVAGTHERIGFVQLPGTSGARVHELPQDATMTVPVQAGSTGVTIPLTGLARQSDTNYQVLMTPSWRAGSLWVAGKGRDGFTVDFDEAAPAGASLDVVVKRAPFRGALTP